MTQSVRYITIDTNVILSLFRRKAFGNGESNERFASNKKTKKYKNYIWDKIFKTNVSVMNKKDFEKFRKTLKEELKNYNYVESLELLVLLQQQTNTKLWNQLVDEGVKNLK